MYWCNCCRSWEVLQGKKDFPKNFYTTNCKIWEYQPVEARDGVCVHCGHTAFYSKTHPFDVLEKRNPKGSRTSA